MKVPLLILLSAYYSNQAYVVLYHSTSSFVQTIRGTRHTCIRQAAGGSAAAVAWPALVVQLGQNLLLVHVLMQAPQRQRVSFSTRWRRPHSSGSSITASQCRTSPPKQRGWKDYIDPSVNMGVPTLLMILEPNIVWGHSHVSSRGTGIGCSRECCAAEKLIPTAMQHVWYMPTGHAPA